MIRPNPRWVTSDLLLDTDIGLVLPIRLRALDVWQKLLSRTKQFLLCLTVRTPERTVELRTTVTDTLCKRIKCITGLCRLSLLPNEQPYTDDHDHEDHPEEYLSLFCHNSDSVASPDHRAITDSHWLSVTHYCTFCAIVYTRHIMTSTHAPSLADTLRSHGFRVTTTRTTLLTLLAKADAPQTVNDLQGIWPVAPQPNHTTLYRALCDLAAAGIITRTDLNTGIAHYEFTPDRPHHHHIVCTNCGYIEELNDCTPEPLETTVCSAARSFTTITDHTLEFFGVCTTCARSTNV